MTNWFNGTFLGELGVSLGAGLVGYGVAKASGASTKDSQRIGWSLTGGAAVLSATGAVDLSEGVTSIYKGLGFGESAAETAARESYQGVITDPNASSSDKLLAYQFLKDSSGSRQDSILGSALATGATSLISSRSADKDRAAARDDLAYKYDREEGLLSTKADLEYNADRNKAIDSQYRFYYGAVPPADMTEEQKQQAIQSQLDKRKAAPLYTKRIRQDGTIQNNTAELMDEMRNKANGAI